MKKVFILLLMIFLMTVLTGCSEEYISITEDESNAIAQYCSHLILKYDKNKTDDTKLLDYKDFKKELEKRAEAEITPTPVITDEPETTPVEQDSEPETDEEPISPAPVPSDESDNSSPPEPVINECTIDEAFGIEGFTFEYKYMTISDSYDTGDKSFALYSTEGQKLAVVEFTVKNITNSDTVLDMTDKEIKYELLDDSGSKHSPVISFMTKDLQFYNESIPAGKEVPVCLVFYIKDGTSPISLKILGKNTYTINFN